MKSTIVLLSIVSTLALAGCASGPKYTEIKGSIPAIAADQGRIYFYRPASMVGAAVQPDIFLNGERVGSSVPGGFFFVDHVAGDCRVSTSTEVEKQATFTLDKGQFRYVKTTVNFGLMVGRVQPELIDPATAEQEIADTSYTGTAPLKK